MLKVIKKTLIISFFTTLFLGAFLGKYSGVEAQSTEEKLNELRNQIEEYSKQIEVLQKQANTLSNQIAEFDAQIRITELKISQTQERIILLGGRIDQLSVSLLDLSNAFNSRAVETYKMSRIESSPLVLVSVENLNKAVSRFYYLRKIQEADRSLLNRLQTAQNTYKEQKGDLEELEEVLESQKQELDKKKAAKAHLLTTTKNDEIRYQELLAAARAEYEAIQAIIAGKGDEEEVGHINAGDRIASIIQGPSCNSDGTHLHFIVARGSNTENPFNYLRPGIDYQNCSGPGECSSADPFNPSGSWDWPIAQTIKLTQGYGHTWAVQNTWVGRIYQSHNGIDIDSLNSSEVKAVRSGKLYRGSYSVSGGCQLRYVRVDHDENDIDTYYLHINY